MEQRCINIFQFHKGSIKTHHVIREVTALHLFQFHKGSIKTLVFADLIGDIFISIP